MRTEGSTGADGLVRRVVLVHNWHRGISGENRVVESDIRLLRDAGVEVEIYARSNDEIDDFGPIRWTGMAVRPSVSPGDARALRRLIDSFRPDIVHVHNMLPLISPWAIRTARSAGVPVVQTVHNYLHVCAVGTYFRDGHLCHDCRHKIFPWPAVVHACLEGTRVSGPVGSRLQTAAVGLSLAVHRSTWHLVDRFVAVGRMVARHLEDMGIEARRVSIRGNPVSDPGPPSPPGTGGLFVGRLRAEKGAHVLLEAWDRSELGRTHVLRLAGDGPDQDRIERVARRIQGVEVLGAVSHERVGELMESAAFVVVPSLWEEPFGLAVVEAMARGRPVLVTNIGEPAEIVDATSGWVAEPTIEGLAAGLRAAFDSPIERMGTAARQRYLDRFSPPVSLRLLLGTYEEARVGRR